MKRAPKTSETKTRKKAPETNEDERFPKRKSAAVAALARYIKRQRKERRLNQAQFAALIESDQSSVSLLENGRSNVTVVQAERIAKALGVAFIDLFR